MSSIIARFIGDASQFDRTVSGMQGRIRSLRSVMASFGVGLSVAGAAIWARRMINEGSRLTDVADKIGLSTTALQAFTFAAKQNGAAQSAAEMGLQRFTRRLAQAQQGAGELLPMIQRYNIALTDSAGRNRTAEAVLRDYADAIRAVKDPQEQLLMAFKGFDSEGAVLVNTLRKGSAGLSEYAAQAEKLGLIISEDKLRQMDALADRIDRIGLRARAVGASLLGPLLTGIERVFQMGEQSQLAREMDADTQQRRASREAQARDTAAAFAPLAEQQLRADPDIQIRDRPGRHSIARVGGARPEALPHLIQARAMELAAHALDLQQAELEEQLQAAAQASPADLLEAAKRELLGAPGATVADSPSGPILQRPEQEDTPLIPAARQLAADMRRQRDLAGAVARNAAASRQAQAAERPGPAAPPAQREQGAFDFAARRVANIATLSALASADARRREAAAPEASAALARAGTAALAPPPGQDPDAPADAARDMAGHLKSASEHAARRAASERSAAEALARQASLLRDQETLAAAARRATQEPIQPTFEDFASGQLGGPDAQFIAARIREEEAALRRDIANTGQTAEGQRFGLTDSARAAREARLAGLREQFEQRAGVSADPASELKAALEDTETRLTEIRDQLKTL